MLFFVQYKVGELLDYNKKKVYVGKMSAKTSIKKGQPFDFHRIDLFVVCPGQDSNLHALKRAPAPQAGVSTNFTTWAGIGIAKVLLFLNYANIFGFFCSFAADFWKET